MIKSITIRNRNGERMQPCLTPVMMSNMSVAVFGSDTASAVGVQRYEYIDDLVGNAIEFQDFPD